MLQTAPDDRILHMAFELSNQKWLLGFSDGRPQTRRVEIKARDLARLLKEMEAARLKFKLPAGCKVVSCYEAGRDGFWLHRWLLAQGVDSCVVDSASIERNRRMRQAKTDKIDVEKLMTLSIRAARGEEKVWRVVQAPAPEIEDVRHLPREAQELRSDITRHANRIKGHLAAQGIVCSTGAKFMTLLPALRTGDGRALGPVLQARLSYEWKRMMEAARQLRRIQLQQRVLMDAAASKPKEVAKKFGEAVLTCLEKANKLRRLRGVDLMAFALCFEFFGWRNFKNRRQVGGLSGMTGVPFNSGDSVREQGLAKSGNRRVRWIAVELAWCWLMYQPQSKLSQWYRESFGKKRRKSGAVALGRQLLVAWWRYLDQDKLPEGAVLKKAA